MKTSLWNTEKPASVSSNLINFLTCAIRKDRHRFDFAEFNSISSSRQSEIKFSHN